MWKNTLIKLQSVTLTKTSMKKSCEKIYYTVSDRIVKVGIYSGTVVRLELTNTQTFLTLALPMTNNRKWNISTMNLALFILFILFSKFYC